MSVYDGQFTDTRETISINPPPDFLSPTFASIESTDPALYPLADGSEALFDYIDAGSSLLPAAPSSIASWFYNELSRDYDTANLATDVLALHKEQAFDSLWDLERKIGVFVEANKEAEDTLFPVILSYSVDLLTIVEVL
jgi:hypothetical protein